MGTAEGNSSRLTSQRPSASEGGRKAAGRRQEDRRRPAGAVMTVAPGDAAQVDRIEQQGATSMYSHPASAAICRAICGLAHPGGPQTMAGWRTSTRSVSVSASSPGRSEQSAEMVSGMTGSGGIAEAREGAAERPSASSFRPDPRPGSDSRRRETGRGWRRKEERLRQLRKRGTPAHERRAHAKSGGQSPSGITAATLFAVREVAGMAPLAIPTNTRDLQAIVNSAIEERTRRSSACPVAPEKKTYAARHDVSSVAPTSTTWCENHPARRTGHARRGAPDTTPRLSNAPRRGHHAAFEAASFARMSAPMLPAILEADALTESRARCA